MTETPILDLVLECARAAADKRATDLLLLEMGKKAGFTSYFLIASGSSDRRVQAIADGVNAAMAARGLRLLGTEGMAEGRWVLLDFGDFVVHVFYEEVRRFYDLEGFWFDAPRVEIPAEILAPPPPGGAPG